MARKKKPSEVIDPIALLSPAKQARLQEIHDLRESTQQIEIKSAQLISGLFCHYGYKHNLSDEVFNEIPKLKSGLPVHDDLKKCFKKLKPHMAVICEEFDPALIEDMDDDELLAIEEVDNFTVTGFSIEGKPGKDGVVLTGYKRLKSGEHLALTTPKKLFGSNFYPFMGDFTIHIYNAIDEVLALMTGKRAPDMQGDLYSSPKSKEPEYVEVDL